MTELVQDSSLDGMLKEEHDPEWDDTSLIEMQQKELDLTRIRIDMLMECMDDLGEDMDMLLHYELFLIDVFYGKVSGLDWKKNKHEEIWQNFAEHFNIK